ncbi:retrovirus-related pol polyprotein from transposon TNT 1-94 [Tanacetum coccineum]
MQHVNTEIIKENQNLRKELKELTKITETWLNSSNKVNQCISEQIPTQKKRILRFDQLTEDPSSSGQNDLIFVKSSADDTKVSILGVERPWLSEAEGFILPNYDTGIILLAESQVNTTDPPIAVNDSSTTEYDSVDESLVCSTPLPPLKKLASAEPVSGPKTIKLILKSNSTFKAEALKGVTINEPSPAPAKAKASASKTNSAPAGKLKNVKTEDDLPLTSVMKELNDLKLQISKNQSSYSRNNKSQQVPQNALQNRYKTQFKKGCELCGLNNHLSENCYKVLVISQRRGEAIQAKKAKAHKSNKTESSNASRSKTPTKRSINHEKYTLVIVDEYSMYTWVYFLKKKSHASETIMSFIKRVENQNDIKVKQLRTDNVYIHNHKDNLGKFDEKADDGYFLGYLLVSKALRVFNTRIQQTEETYHITFDESTDAIKFTKPSLNNIYIAESERYPPDE